MLRQARYFFRRPCTEINSAQGGLNIGSPGYEMHHQQNPRGDEFVGDCG